jgi:FAD/FMN-containing dehydrogenase
MLKMDRIIEIRDDTVTAQASALYLDVNQELQKRNLQFYVNLELGNLSMGSAATGGTKDASMPGEFGQVASYAIGIKMATPDGQLVDVTDADPELLQVAQSSYGLFAVVYEVTFRVRRLEAMHVYHQTFTLDEFASQLLALKARNESMMLYLNPFLDSIAIEFRPYRGAARATRPCRPGSGSFATSSGAGRDRCTRTWCPPSSPLHARERS